MKTGIRKPHSGITVRIRILAYFIIVSLFSYIFFYYVVYKTYRRVLINQTNIHVNQILDTTSANVESLLNEITSITFDIYSDNTLNSLIMNYNKEPILKNRIELSDYIRSNWNSYLNNKKYIISMRVYTKDITLVEILQGETISGDIFDDSIWYQNVLNADGSIVCTPTYQQNYVQTGTIYPERIISFARAIKNLSSIYTNEKIGIIVIDFNEEYLKSLFRRALISRDSNIVLENDYGYILSSSSEELIGKNNLYAFAPGKVAIAENTQSVTIDGEECIYSLRRLDKLDWKIHYFTPINSELLNSKMFNSSIVFFIIMMILALFAISFLITDRTLKPLKNLMSALKIIKGGDLSLRLSIKNNDELGQIADQFNQMLDSIQKLVKENYIIKLSEKQAELEALQAQINPHFIYNTLDTISWHTMPLGDPKVNKIICALGEIMRYNISRTNKIVTLKEEMDQIKNYLFIQMTRYENRFDTYLRNSPDTLELQIRKSLIQPIVENAMKHGLENKVSGGILFIGSKVLDNSLIIEVFDNGAGISPDKLQLVFGENEIDHIGIRNVHKRIQLYYGDEYGVEIKSRQGGYTKVILRLPVVKG